MHRPIHLLRNCISCGLPTFSTVDHILAESERHRSSNVLVTRYPRNARHSDFTGRRRLDVLSTRQIDENTVLWRTTNVEKALTCLCYHDQVTRMTEMEIDLTHYRLQMGLISLLNEDEALEKARSRTSDLITAAAQDDEVGHEEHTCKSGETAHLKAW